VHNNNSPNNKIRDSNMKTVSHEQQATSGMHANFITMYLRVANEEKEIALR